MMTRYGRQWFNENNLFEFLEKLLQFDYLLVIRTSKTPLLNSSGSTPFGAETKLPYARVDKLINGELFFNMLVTCRIDPSDGKLRERYLWYIASRSAHIQLVLAVL